MDIYCGQLGMVAEFSYCLSAGGGMPCRNAVGCWRERTDIAKFLKAAFTEEQLKTCFGGLPKSRMERIMESLKSAIATDSDSATERGDDEAAGVV
jgi:hypothetical protein